MSAPSTAAPLPPLRSQRQQSAFLRVLALAATFIFLNSSEHPDPAQNPAKAHPLALQAVPEDASASTGEVQS